MSFVLSRNLDSKGTNKKSSFLEPRPNPCLSLFLSLHPVLNELLFLLHLFKPNVSKVFLTPHAKVQQVYPFLLFLLRANQHLSCMFTYGDIYIGSALPTRVRAVTALFLTMSPEPGTGPDSLEHSSGYCLPVLNLLWFHPSAGNSPRGLPGVPQVHGAKSGSQSSSSWNFRSQVRTDEFYSKGQ